MKLPTQSLKADVETENRELRRVFGQFATGVSVIVGVTPDGAPVGVTANSLTSVSLDPPLFLWCLANKSRNIGAFKAGAPFAIHVLAEGQADVALHFARSSEAKFDGRHNRRDSDGLPIVEGVLARMVCHVTALSIAGDHTIIVGRIDTCELQENTPLVFHASRFGRFVAHLPDPGQEPWGIFVEMWS